MRSKLASGDIQSTNDLITYNLDIRQFAQDVIENCEGPDLLRAFWRAIREVTVLDPTCGSGAFLFAALNVLEPLYEACLNRMEVFLDELNRSGKKHRPEKFDDFRKALDRGAKHASPRSFIYKSIIVNNLYGVDIMEEAVEICKLRLFLKMIAQVDRVEHIVPLPDIDFNIRTGNTLVGYVTYDAVKQAVQSKLDFENVMVRIEQKAQDSVFSDCEHINDGLIRGFHIPEDWGRTDWARLSRRLSASIQATSVRKTIATRQGHTIEYAEITALNSKSIIDEIDRILAKHYGFTDEELDFIINYDIKYRMGQDAEENGDS